MGRQQECLEARVLGYTSSAINKPKLVHLGGDSCRKFVVVEFNYGKDRVKQCFYRTSGSNSTGQQFGEEFSHLNPEGTWFPTNGIVVSPMISKDDRSANLMILKKPFLVNMDSPHALSRFGGDKILASVSCALGGGVWESPEFVEKLSLGIVPGSLEIPKGSSVSLTGERLNAYINSAISWNYRVGDKWMRTLFGGEEVKMSKFRMVLNGKRVGVPSILMNYPEYSLKRILDGPEVIRKAMISQVRNHYRLSSFENEPELVPRDGVTTRSRALIF